MKKSIFFVIVFIIILFATAVFLFLNHENKDSEYSTAIVRKAEILPVSFSVASTTLSVVDNGKVTQTLSLDEEGEFAYNLSPNHETPAFTTTDDFNFDGNSDVSKLVSTGYTGVNYFYEYYLYNPETRMLERSSALEGISNPYFDVQNKRIISSYRSGPQWYSEVFQWNGTTYVKEEAE